MAKAKNDIEWEQAMEHSEIVRVDSLWILSQLGNIGDKGQIGARNRVRPRR